jgi:VanZ family protein
METKLTKLLDFFVLVLYCALIYWLSSQKSLPMPKVFDFQDKVVHAGAYFVMSLLAWRYFRHFSQRTFISFILAVGFCSFYGATDEWHQSFVPGRSSDIFDWVADTTGAIFAMWGFYWLKLKQQNLSVE